LGAIGNYISNTQTAYVRNRNITDNIRLISNVIQLSNYEPFINGSVLALDAQKAFDSVNHIYLNKILEYIGLGNFSPIFKLLYRNLVNEMVINGQIIGHHRVQNGVKQGDALSCTLFILAIEPLLRNIEKNGTIQSVKSAFLDYKWPKVLGYADDITCITVNEETCQQAIFSEYEKFSKLSGLKLNADKTEMLNFRSDRPDNGNRNVPVKVNYLDKSYEIAPLSEIKINGIVLSKDMDRQKVANCELLMSRMEGHFKNWQKRHLTLLGKIQIYKTFGLSQFLYHLAVIEPDVNIWKRISEITGKFLWNKNMANNRAPQRIKQSTMLTPIEKGGLGMLDLREVVAGLRLRRHFILLNRNIHPLHILLNKLLEGTSYLSDAPSLNLDPVVNCNMKVLAMKRLADCLAPEWQLEGDLILHTNMLRAKTRDLIRVRKRNSNEAAQLGRRALNTLWDVVQSHRQNLNILIKITHKETVTIIKTLARIYVNTAIPPPLTNKIRDGDGRWMDCHTLSSRSFREIIFSKELSFPKIVLLNRDDHNAYFTKIKKLVSVRNKNGIIRILYGDVYSGDRLARSGLADNDICRRCFGKETLMHLLSDCPYTQAVLSLIGINSEDITEVLGINASRQELEIRSDIINYLVFRQHILPPDILVRTTLERYVKGIVIKKGSEKVAQRLLNRLGRS